MKLRVRRDLLIRIRVINYNKTIKYIKEYKSNKAKVEIDRKD